MGCNGTGKLLVSELFWGLEGGSKRSLSLRTQLYKMQHGNKTDLLTEKRKLSGIGRIMSLPNAENRGAKTCQGTVKILRCIFEHGGARLTVAAG